MEVNTTKPGRFSLSLPNPYNTHEPMLGRPLMSVPVFINVCAGSWLMASVRIERMMASSSATPPKCGNSSEISYPARPCFLKANCGRRQVSFCPCNCAMDWPAVNESGIGWRSSLANSGLGSNVSKCDGPPAM